MSNIEDDLAGIEWVLDDMDMDAAQRSSCQQSLSPEQSYSGYES